MIPVFNAEPYLAECLDSVLAAEVPGGVEIVAVDDGSTDGSPAILRDFAARHGRLQVHVRTNAGPAAARNFGLARATGGHVWFVDADDVVKPDAWRVLPPLLAEEHDIVVFNGERFGGAGAAHAFYTRSKPAGIATGRQWMAMLCAQREFHHLVYLHLYRREFLQRHALAFREGMLHEDIGWVTESYLCAERVIYVDRVLYGYRRNTASLTGGREDAKLLRRIESYFEVVPQLRALNAKYAPDGALRRMLRAEIVAQGLQVDRLGSRLQSQVLRDDVRARCRRERFWMGLWPDATTFKAKRQLAKVLARQYLSRP